MSERPGYPRVGPHDRPALICDWLVWLEAELIAGGPDEAASLAVRRAIARADCWLHDHRFPAERPATGD